MTDIEQLIEAKAQRDTVRDLIVDLLRREAREISAELFALLRADDLATLELRNACIQIPDSHTHH